MKSGVQLNVPVPSPLSTNVAPGGSGEALSAGIVPSGSLADTPNVSNTFSVVLCGPIGLNTGAWLPASFTVIVTTSESTARLSSVA